MKQGQPPLLDQKGMLDLLQLSGDTPDGKSLAERLLNSRNLLDKVCPPSGEQIEVLKRTLSLTGQLLGRLAETNETPYQHMVAENLVAVAERQIRREHAICPIATDLGIIVKMCGIFDNNRTLNKNTI